MPHSDLIGQHKAVCESRIVTCVDCGINMSWSNHRVHQGAYLCEMVRTGALMSRYLVCAFHRAQAQSTRQLIVVIWVNVKPCLPPYLRNTFCFYSTNR